MADDLGHAQERLGRTLARARATEDRELLARVRDEGFQLVHLLNGVLNMSRLHSPDNHAFDQPLRDLERTFSRLMALLGPLHLVCVEDQVYLNEIRIRGDERGQSTRALGAELKRHGVGGLRFFDEPREAHLRRLAGCLSRPPAPSEPRAALRQALEAQGLAGIEAAGLFRFRTSDERPVAQADAREVLTRAQDVLAEAWDNLGRRRLPNPLPLRRVVTEILASGSACDALWTLPEGDQPHVTHALRVAWLALALGRTLGLPDGALQDLGVAALLHDVGYAGPPDAAEPPAARRTRHAARGAWRLLRQRGFHEAKVRRARALLHHHRDAGQRPRPTLSARLLRLCDDYDTLVRRGGSDLDPTEALGRIAAAGPQVYDPVLVQALVNTLGRWPPGALMKLDDGRRARVVAPGGGGAATFERPIVIVERLADGRPATGGERIDLSRPASRGGAPAQAPARAPVPPAPPPAPSRPAAARAPAAAPTSPARAQPAVFALENDDTFTFDDMPARPSARTRPDDDEGLGDVLGALDDSGQPAAGAVEDDAEMSGELTPAGLPLLLADMRERRRTGLLLLQSGSAQCRLRFAGGELVEVSGGRGATASQPAPAAREARLALARRLVSDLADWDDGDYLFSPQQPGATPGATETLPTAALVLDLVRRFDDPDVVRFALGDLDVVLSLSPEVFQAGGPQLDSVDRAVLASVDGRTTAREILARVPGDPDDARRSLLGLRAAALVRRA